MPLLPTFRRLTKPSVRSRWALAGALVPVSLLLVSCTSEPPAPATTTNPSTSTTTANGTSGTSTGNAGAFDSPRKPEGDISIMIVTNGISPFWTPMTVGMDRAASDMGCNADWQGPQNGTVSEQKQIVEQALAKGVDGLALSSIDAKSAEPLIKMALDKNIPVITFDSDSDKSGRLAYIGTNNYSAGEAAGRKAVELMPNGGKFVGFVGNISAPNARERYEGFLAATKDHNLTVAQVIDDQKSSERARRNVEDAMGRYGTQVTGLLGLFSYNGPAIVQAVTNLKKRDQYKIVAFDAEPGTLNALDKGSIDATVVQKPYEFGYQSTKLLYLVNRKGWTEAKKEMKIPEDSLIDTGVEVITPANVADYRKRLAKLGIKSS